MGPFGATMCLEEVVHVGLVCATGGMGRWERNVRFCGGMCLDRGFCLYGWDVMVGGV